MARTEFEFFQGSTSPVYWRVCPKCLHGIDSKSIKTVLLRDPEREAERRRGELEPPDDQGDYTASYTCTSCMTNLAAAGRWSVDLDCCEDEDGLPRQVWVTFYSPGWLSEFPHLVEVPRSTPKSIVDAVRRADPLFWVDFNACGAALRQVVEVFLDEQGVARTATRSDGKSERFLSFEARIEQFVVAIEKVSKAAADEYETLLRATKFKGNDAVHGLDTLTGDQLELLSRLLARVLQMRYPDRDLLAEAAKLIGGRHSRRARASATSATASNTSSLTPPNAAPPSSDSATLNSSPTAPLKLTAEN